MKNCIICKSSSKNHRSEVVFCRNCTQVCNVEARAVDDDFTYNLDDYELLEAVKVMEAEIERTKNGTRCCYICDADFLYYTNEVEIVECRDCRTRGPAFLRKLHVLNKLFNYTNLFLFYIRFM